MEQVPVQAFAIGTGHDARAGAFDPRMKPIYIGLGVSWAALLVAMPLANVSLDGVLTAAFLAICGLFTWGAACLRMRGLARIAVAIESWMLLTLACLTGILGTYVAARLSAPFADSWMASADRWVAPGLGWQDTVLAISRQPLPMRVANRVYASIQWQGSLLILLCCVAGHAERCAAFVLRWMIALALVCAIFALLPCNGPYAYYHIARDAVPSVHSAIGWRQPELLAWLRAPGPVRLDPSALDGIVEFPSFHTAAAILFAWGFWPVRWARWPMLTLNLVMIAASVPVGGHYYVDVVAGALVAWIAILAPDWAGKPGSVSV